MKVSPTAKEKQINNQASMKNMEVTLFLRGRHDNFDETQNELPELTTISDDEKYDDVIDKISDDKESTKPVSITKSILFPKKITEKKSRNLSGT